MTGEVDLRVSGPAPVEIEAGIAAVIAVGDPIGDLPTARGDLERLGRGTSGWRRSTIR